MICRSSFSYECVRWAVLGRRLGRLPAQCYNSFYSIYVDTTNGGDEGSTGDSDDDGDHDRIDVSSTQGIDLGTSSPAASSSSFTTSSSVKETDSKTTRKKLTKTKTMTMTMTMDHSQDYDYHRIKQKSRMWDRDEDAVLMGLVDALGNDWKAIGHKMSRTNVQVVRTEDGNMMI